MWNVARGRWSAELTTLAVILAAGCMTRGAANDAGGASGGPGPAPRPSSSVISTITNQSPPTESACKACNGEWTAHGLARKPSCNCRTGDAGKACRDEAECQGKCVAAEPAERAVVEQGPPVRGYFVGRCSEFVAVFGCKRFIARGAIEVGAVDLSVPPRMVCFD